MLEGMIKYDDQRSKRKNDKISGVEEMQQMAVAALEARRIKDPVLGLDGEGLPLIAGEPMDHYLVAHRDCKFRTDSVVGTINRGQFEDMLGVLRGSTARPRSRRSRTGGGSPWRG